MLRDRLACDARRGAARVARPKRSRRSCVARSPGSKRSAASSTSSSNERPEGRTLFQVVTGNGVRPCNGVRRNFRRRPGAACRRASPCGSSASSRTVTWQAIAVEIVAQRAERRRACLRSPAKRLQREARPAQAARSGSGARARRPRSRWSCAIGTSLTNVPWRVGNAGVVAATFDFDRRQRAAARARRRLHAHAVAQVVANDRLQVIGEIGQQHRVRQLAGRSGLVIAIHGFQDDPVRVHVQGAFAAAVADGQAFRGAVFVDAAGIRTRPRSPYATPASALRRRPTGPRAAVAAGPPAARRRGAPASSDNWRRTRADRRSALRRSGSGDVTAKLRMSSHGLPCATRRHEAMLAK